MRNIENAALVLDLKIIIYQNICNKLIDLEETVSRQVIDLIESDKSRTLYARVKDCDALLRHNVIYLCLKGLALSATPSLIEGDKARVGEALTRQENPVDCNIDFDFRKDLANKRGSVVHFVIFADRKSVV